MERYAKIKKIGEGSFGKALLVRNKENGKQYVVKEINMVKMAKKERDEARKEVAVLAQLNHPNIVTYRESFEEIGNLYIVMDFCDAGDLYGRINTQRGILFDENQIIDWFVQTCLAIKHIHDRKILHRDIKSQNIFLTRHGIVKLGDFGIAKVLNSTVELARTCIGTPYYLSPEMCENKPYNNKSDIWSLGCVLYELTTLKHAFEAGNMKNLVLKIIRGNFPPPPPRYSYDLRSLINQLFKRSPRDRPSINSVLKKPILQQRIKRFLSESEVADEFSHTVMHGVKMKKVLPAGGVRPLPPKPVAVKKPPVAPAASPRYNPASVYGVPLNRKSKDGGSGVKKSSDVRKSGGAKKPSSSGGAVPYNADLARKKQELQEKERKRREEAKKKEDMYAKQHRELLEKQKMARMKKAREDGWKGLVDSLSSDDSNRKHSPHGAKIPSKKKLYVSPYSQHKSSPRSEEFKKPAPVYKPVRPVVAANPTKDQRPSYDHYHDYLDRLERDRKAAAAAPTARPVSAREEARDRGGGGGGVDPQRFDPGFNAMRGQAAGAQGHVAAGKARMVEEYMQRKQQAAVNKARAQGDLFGGAKLAVNPPRAAPSPKPSSGAPKPSAGQQKPQPSPRADSRSSDASANDRARPVSAREKSEQEYLARLKQIRLQNFNERRSVQDRPQPKEDDRYKPPKVSDADARKKKIEALRAQADERAKNLKEKLEHKRKEAYDLEKRNLQLQNAARHQHGARPAIAAAKPVPAVPITQVLGAIGAAPQEPKPSKAGPSIGMTAAMNAIGASREEENRVSIQKTKEQILKRLNAKPPDKPEAAASDKPENKGERHKWGSPVKPPVVDSRLKWGEDANLTDLHNLTLEQTASQMEATSARDNVLRHGEAQSSGKSGTEDGEGDSQQSNRKQWAARPSGTVVNMLKAAGLNETSSSNVSVVSDSSESSSTTAQQPSIGGSTVTLSKPSDNKLPVIGSTTITISKCPNKGTVVIKRAEGPGDQGDVIDAPVQGLQSQKEMVISEEKEEDESEDVVKAEVQTIPQDEKDDIVKESLKKDPVVKTSEPDPTGESQDKPDMDKKSKTAVTPPRLKSRSPSPRPRSPKTSPLKPKKVHQPEIQVEITDLSDEKAALFSKVELDDEDKDSKEEEGGKEDIEKINVEDLEEGEIIDVRGGTPEPGEVYLSEDRIQSSNTNLLLGLTTGHFDIGDVKMLRTCSEPNLARLFKTDLVENPFFTDDEVSRSVQAAAEFLEEREDNEDEDEAAQVRASLQKVMDQQDGEDEEEDEENLGYSVRDIADLIGDEEEEEVEGDSDPDVEQEQEEEEDEDEDQEELECEEHGEGSDADLETLRQSMMDILDNEGTISDEEAISAKKKTKKSSTKVGKVARKKRREKKQAEEAAAKAGDSEQKAFYARQWSASSVEDFQNMRETMKTLLQSDSASKKKLPVVKEAGPGGDASDGPTVTDPDALVSLNPNTDAWQSDDETVDDDYWEEEDMFSRLEESRMKLEEELGCDTFMKAYKTVQAIHEDEDENMEEGLQLVTRILGVQKSHLYPSILQLVMADGVWTEDNE